MDLSQEDIRPHADGWSGFVRFMALGVLGTVAVLVLLAVTVL